MLAIDCKMKAATHGIENSPELKYIFVRHGPSSQRLDLPMSREPTMGPDRQLADGSRHYISHPLCHKAASVPKSATVPLATRDRSSYRQRYRRDYTYPYLSTRVVARHDQDHQLWRSLINFVMVQHSGAEWIRWST